MRSLSVIAIVVLVTVSSAEYFTQDVAILKYKALEYNEMENLEHLSYTFDFCLCTSNFTGLYPNKDNECQCTLQQKGRRVIESIPQAVFSASCIHTYSPAKCLNAKFTGTTLGTKIYVRVSLGKSVFTYPSWQTLVNSRYKTVSTLKSAAGFDMRITYISFSRRMVGENPSWTKIPASTTAQPWKNKQPTEQSLEVEPSAAGFRDDIFDILRAGYNKGMSWALKSLKKITGDQDFKQEMFTKPTTRARRPWSIATTTVKPSTTATTTQFTTRRPSSVTIVRPAPGSESPVRNIWDISDVASIRSMSEITNYLLKKTLADKVNPAKYDIEAVKRALVMYHNLYRERHDAPEVKTKSDLNMLAQRYADKLARSGSCLVHETPRKYGENLFVYGAQSYPDTETLAKAVTQSFYMESFGYNYNSWIPRSYHKTGHFTQLVWKESRHIGVGVSIVKSDGRVRGPCFPRAPVYMIYICVKYDPAGNFETSEAYKRNVLPLKRF